MGRSRRKKKKLLSLVITLIILIVGAFTAKKALFDEKYEIPDGNAEFHFIDVGQGDASLIMVGGKSVLIDTGDKSADDALFEYLNSHNVTELEYFIVTHPDSDHYASAVKVMDNYTVKNLIMTEHEKTTAQYEEFIEAVEKHTEINVISANQSVGKSYFVNDLEIKLIAPLKSYSDPNAESIVFIARYGEKKVMYTGDAEKETEEDIIAQYGASALACDVLKVGHHCSDTSSSQEFVSAVNPKFAVISCGTDNKYGHPHAEPLARLEAINGITIYRTDKDGSIVLNTDGATITKK